MIRPSTRARSGTGRRTQLTQNDCAAVPYIPRLDHCPTPRKNGRTVRVPPSIGQRGAYVAYLNRRSPSMGVLSLSQPQGGRSSVSALFALRGRSLLPCGRHAARYSYRHRICCRKPFPTGLTDLPRSGSAVDDTVMSVGVVRGLGFDAKFRKADASEIV
ncbi:hypothetical protein BC834DRAFT_120185 [Gloeopeniophorella convolvens]|nr:hypothetical protein BC834DRAFT_120185 [Gloeopeniophorella convolvens]